MPSPDKPAVPAPVKLKELPPLSYGRMRQRNEEYDGDRMQELHDLYAGGYEIQKRAKRYLRLVTNEHARRHEERCQQTAYIGYFGQVTEQFTSDLFAQPLSIMAPADDENPKTPGEPPSEFYKEFEGDCDLEGTPFVDLMADAMTTALVQRTSYVAIDAKAPEPGEEPPANRAQEEASGALRFYAYEVSPREVIDWKLDKRGGFEWVIINRLEQDRASPFDIRDEVVENFLVWTMVEGFARWQRYEIRYSPDKPPDQKDLVELVAEGRTSFRRIPVLRMRLKKGLWVGNCVGPAQKEHWHRRSCLNSAQARSMFAIPYVKRGPEIGARGAAQPSETQEDPNRGADPVGTFQRTGSVEIGADDEIGFAEPEGKCYAQVAKELDELKDEIFRVVHMMAASVRPSAGMMGRSAASKQQDGKATALVLRALGKVVREFALQIYRTMAAARGEGETKWVANGLDNYEVIDREQVIAEALSLDLIDIPSETFAITLAMQVAEKLLTGISPDTADSIRKEIEKGVKEKFAQKQLERDVAKAALESGEPPPGAPVPPKPGAPKPPGQAPPKPAAPKAPAAGAKAA